MLSTNLAGYALASLSLVLFGLYMVPRKLTTLRDLPFVLSACLGVVVTSAIGLLVVHGGPPATAPSAFWLAFVCGPPWYAGVLFYTISVSRMGLTLSTPIKNTTAVLGTLVGLVVFDEWRETRPLPAVLGSVLVVLCAVILSRTGESDSPRRSLNVRGVLAAIAAAVFFAAYAVPLKLAQRGGLDSATLVAYVGLGTLVAAVVSFALFDRDWRGWWGAKRTDHGAAALCGLMWVIATIAMAEAIKRIGLAITWPFINLNTIVTVACGIVLFHEVSLRKFWRTIVFGLTVGIAGMVLLGLARR